jgi:YD repeat-containing protein
MATALAIAVASGGATSSVDYRYDPLGRIVTAHYDDGLCVVYAYDQNGNRTSQTNSTGSGSSTWGSGVWGCFTWAP